MSNGHLTQQRQTEYSEPAEILSCNDENQYDNSVDSE